MNQREGSLFGRVRLPQVALATASSIVILSCSGCVRGAQGIHPTVRPEQELISPTITILPAGTRVTVRLLQTLNTHTSQVIEDVPFQVVSDVRVGDFTVIARGTSATGRAYITSPDGFARKAQIYLVLGSTTAVTATEISLGAILNEMGGSCGTSLDCSEGGHAAVGEGTEIEAFVAEDVALSTPKLQAFALEKRRISARLIANHQLKMRIHIYLLPAEGTARVRVSLDGRKIGRVGPGEHLTLLPSPGKHVIAIKDYQLTVELAPTEQYYVRVSETGSWPRTKVHLKLVALDQGQDDIIDLVGVPVDQH
jgi:hypothetical protein